MFEDQGVTPKKIGQTLIEEGFLTEQNVHIVLLRQEFGDSRLFGQIAASLNYLSRQDLEGILPQIQSF